MPKIDITSKEAVQQLNIIIQTFKEQRKQITGVGEQSVISYRKMVTALKELKKQEELMLADLKEYDRLLKNMTKSQKNFVTQVRNLKNELKLTNESLKKANAELERLKRQKNIFSGAISSVRNLVAAFGVLTGIQLFARAISSAFNLTKQLDSLSFAMKAVITDSRELAQTQRWLGDITDRFGAELITTTNRFIKFRAASKNAGLSASATQKIFGTMTKVAGVLGLRTDELTGIFLALEQMVSKGKVTTEELRRQLGERLPGAMDILANSMGVTTRELDDMMKKGLVITKEVLPGFADEVNKAFGLDSVNTVETLQAATIRLKNAWTTLISDLNSGSGISQKLMRIFDFLAKNLELVVKVTLSFIATWSVLKIVLLANRTAIGAVQIATAGLNGVIAILTGTTVASTAATKVDTVAKKGSAAATVTLSTATKELIASMRALWATLAANPWGLALAGVAALIAYIVLMKDSFTESRQEIQKQDQAMSEAAQKASELARSNGALLDTYKDLKSQIANTKEGTKEFKELNDELDNIMIQLGKNVPVAVTAVNEYGNALALNIPLLEETLRLQRENAGLELSIAAGSEAKVLDDVNKKLSELSTLKEEGTKTTIEGIGKVKKIGDEFFARKWVARGRGISLEWVAFKEKDIVELNKYNEKLIQLKVTAEGIIKQNNDAKNKALNDPFGLTDKTLAQMDELKKKSEGIKKAFQDSQTIPGLDAQISDLNDKINAVYTNVADSDEQLIANRKKIAGYQQQIADIQKKKNFLLGIEEKAGTTHLKKLTEIRDIQLRINALLDRRRVIENQITANDETLNLDIREDAVKKLAFFEIEESAKVRDQKIVDAQAYLDEKLRMNQEELEKAPTQARKDEIEENSLLLKQEYAQKKLFAEEEYTNKVIQIVDKRNKTILSLEEQGEKEALDNKAALYDEQIFMERARTQAVLQDSINRQNGAVAAFNASKKGLKDEIALQKAISAEEKIRFDEKKRLADEEVKIEFEKAKALLEAKIALREQDIEKLNVDTQSEEIKQLLNEIAILKKALTGLELPPPEESNVKKWQESLLDILDAASEFADNIGAIFDAISDRRIENIEAQIEKSNERFDALIELEEGNALQQDLLERAKEAEEKRLKAKKLKEEQKAAKRQKAMSILQIQLDLAKTITAHNLAAANMNAVSLGTLGTIYAAIEIPLAIANAAAQTAAVLAAPIPQYAKGGNISEDHLGLINDGGSQEYIERAGRILTTEKENAIVPLKTGDIVYPSYEELAQKSILVTGISKGLQLEQREFNILFDNIEKSIEKGWRKAKISTNVKVVGFDPEFARYKESLTDWSK